jgi:hypothetical protein
VILENKYDCKYFSLVEKMNTKLVNSLVQIIESLTEEERQLLDSQLDRQKNWQPGFFEETIGGWVGEPLVRPEQSEYEIREELNGRTIRAQPTK